MPIDPFIGAALVSGGVKLASSLLGGLFGKSSSDKTNQTNVQIARETNEANMRLAQYQNEENLRRWEMQNEYDLPINQRQRFQDAGLNPYLMYQNGANATSQAIPAAERANLAPYQVSNEPAQHIANMFRDFGTSVADSVNSYYQNDLLRSQVIKTLADAKGQDILNKNQEQYLGDTMKQTLDNMRKDAALRDEEIKNAKVTRTLVRLQAEVQKELSRKTKYEANHTIEHIKNTVLERTNIKKMANQIDAQTRYLRSQHDYTRALTTTQNILNEQWYTKGLSPQDNVLARFLLLAALEPNSEVYKNLPTNLASNIKGLIQGIQDAFSNKPEAKTSLIEALTIPASAGHMEDPRLLKYMYNYKK